LAAVYYDVVQAKLALPDGDASVAHDMLVLKVAAPQLLAVGRRLKSELGFDLLLDVKSSITSTLRVTAFASG